MNDEPKNWRKMLTDLGGWDNELISVPAGAVRKIIEDVEALRAAAQAVPQLQRQAVATVVSRCGDDLRVGWLRPERCNVGTLLFCAVEPTDTTAGE